MNQTIDTDCRITASEVRKICGGISDMTLHRWLHNEALGFPRPTYILGRRYFHKGDVQAWLEAQNRSQDAA